MSEFLFEFLSELALPSFHTNMPNLAYSTFHNLRFVNVSLYGPQVHVWHRNKTIHLADICQQNWFDGNYPYSFNHLFLIV